MRTLSCSRPVIGMTRADWVVKMHGQPVYTYSLFVCLLLNGTSALFRPLKNMWGCIRRRTGSTTHQVTNHHPPTSPPIHNRITAGALQLQLVDAEHSTSNTLYHIRVFACSMKMSSQSKCRSPIWNFFNISSNDASKAVCKCGSAISRGKSLHSYSTSTITNRFIMQRTTKTIDNWPTLRMLPSPTLRHMWWENNCMLLLLKIIWNIDIIPSEWYGILYLPALDCTVLKIFRFWLKSVHWAIDA